MGTLHKAAGVRGGTHTHNMAGFQIFLTRGLPVIPVCLIHVTICPKLLLTYF